MILYKKQYNLIEKEQNNLWISQLVKQFCYRKKPMDIYLQVNHWGLTKPKPQGKINIRNLENQRS